MGDEDEWQRDDEVWIIKDEVVGLGKGSGVFNSPLEVLQDVTKFILAELKCDLSCSTSFSACFALIGLVESDDEDDDDDGREVFSSVRFFL